MSVTRKIFIFLRSILLTRIINTSINLPQKVYGQSCTTSAKTNSPDILELWDMTYIGGWYDKTTDWQDYFTSDCSYLTNCKLVTSSTSTVQWNTYPSSVNVQSNGKISMKFDIDEFEPVNVYLYCQDPYGQPRWSSKFKIGVRDYCSKDSTYQAQSQGDIKAKQYDSTPGSGTNKQEFTNSSSTYLTIPSDPNWHNSQTCKFKDCEWSYFLLTVPGECGTTTSTNPTVKSFNLAAQTWTFEIDTSVPFENKQCYRCNWQNSGSSINNRWSYNGWISVQVKAATDCTFFLGSQQIKYFDGGSSFRIYDYRVATGSFGVANIATGYAYVTYLTGGDRYATTSDFVNCPLSFYYAVSAQSFSASSPMSNYVNCDYTTGKFSYRTDSLYSYWFRITINSQITNPDLSLGPLYFVNTNWFLVDIQCGSNSQVATDPSTLKTWQIWEINNAQPYFSFTDQTFGNTDCPCKYYQKITQSTSSSGATNLVSSVQPSNVANTQSTYYVQVSSSEKNNEATYQFYLHTYCTGGYQQWSKNVDTAVNSSTIMTLVVYCGLNSGFITQTSNYYSTLSDPQYVGKSDVNTLGTKYVLPKFTDATYCVITTYQSSSSNSAVVNPGSGFVNNPVAFSLNSAYKQVEPHDKTVDATYYFYIKVTQTGGKTLFSSLMTLVVGCQSTGTTWTDGTNNAKSVIVGSTTSKVYTFNPPSISNTYCIFAYHNIINVVNSRLTPSTNGVFKSTTCSSLTCLDIDLYSTQVTQTITFQIQTCTTFGSLCRISPTITITVVCSALSNTAAYGGQLISTMNNFTATYSQYVINQIFGIKPFTCTYTDCCQTFTYAIVSDSLNPTTTTYASSIFTTPISSGSQYQTTVYTGEIKTYYLYVYVKTEWTNTLISSKVTIDVIYNCSFVKISYNTTMPQQGTDNNKFSSEGYPYINYQNSSQGLPYIVIYETIGVTKGFKVDITQMFVKNTTNCPPISQYVIYQVIQNSTAQNILSGYYNQLFSLGINNGTFQLIDLNTTEYYNYQITINASNGDVWGGTLEKQPQIYATLRKIYEFKTYPPYFDPYEFSLVQNITINITYKIDDKGNEIYTNSQEDIIVNTPTVYDKQGYDTNMTFLNPDQLKFVSFSAQPLNLTQNILIIEQKGLQKQDIGIYKIFLKVTNTKGASSLYKFFIIVRIQGDSIQKIIRQKKDLYKDKNLVHGRIKQITGDGIMIVKFNQSMLTNFDYLSQLNNETIDIYVKPAMDRDLEYGYDDKSIRLNWTLLNFTNDTMIFQLQFFQPEEISPLIVFDKIVLNFTHAAHLLFSKKNMLDKGNEYKMLGRNLIDKSDYVYDQLEQRLLLDPELYLYDPVFFVLFGKIPRQNSEFNKSWIDSIADNMVDLLIVGLFIGMIIGFFFSNTIWFVLAYIRYLQICLHLPMLSIPVPSNVMRFMRRSLPAAKIDVFRYFWKEINYQQLFDWDAQRAFQNNLPDQTVELGYETHNSLVNLSGLAFYLTAAFAFIILAKFLSISCKIVRCDIEKKLENTRLYRPFRFLTDLIFYRAFLFVVLFGFMEFIIAGFLGVQINLQSTIPEQIQIYFSYIFLYFAVLFLPTIYIYILQNDARLKKSEEFYLQISIENNLNNPVDVSLNLSEGQSYIEVSQEDQENQNPEQTFEQSLNLLEGGEKSLGPSQEEEQEKMRRLFERQKKIKQEFSMLNFALHEKKQLSSFFYPLYLLRRVLYLLIVQYVQNFIYQFLLMVLLNLISMCYVAHSNPMGTRIQNYVENFNQLSEVFVTLHLAWYTDYVLSRKQQVQFYGLMQIIVICSHGLISLMIIYYWIARHLYLILLKIYIMFLQKYFERLAKWCWTKSACWRKCCDEKKLDLNDVEINELKPGTQTHNDKGGFSANYLIMQKLNQNKTQGKRKKLRQLVNLNPKKAMILNMSEILEEADEDETVNQEEGLADQNKVENPTQNTTNPVNPLDIPSFKQTLIRIPNQDEAIKIYGEEGDDSDFENSGPIYYDFNDQERGTGDWSEGSKQSFKESTTINHEISNQVITIQTVESQVEQATEMNGNMDKEQIQQNQISSVSLLKMNPKNEEKSIFYSSPASTFRVDTPEFNKNINDATQVDKESQQDKSEDSEFEDGPIYYDFNDQDRQIQPKDSKLYQVTTATETMGKQQILLNQISSQNATKIPDKSIFKQSPLTTYRSTNQDNNQKITLTLEDVDSVQQIKRENNENKDNKDNDSDSEIEQGPIYYDFND